MYIQISIEITDVGLIQDCLKLMNIIYNIHLV